MTYTKPSATRRQIVALMGANYSGPVICKCDVIPCEHTN